ncbi:MAG: hypothetical protein U0984_16580 [Prosthecobacter sp.]|nr:hypothetical protein [Prosthecobacter sp.]
MKKLLSITLLAMAWTATAEEAPKGEGEETQGRVQYALILPEEKSPELVKAEENSPFESGAGQIEKDEGNTEENQVREILLRLPAVGGASGPMGMRVMLGGMRLVEGAAVPPVLPDQQVALKVKSITSSAVELLWVDKKPTGLPPKVLTIPLDGAPKVRYQLPANSSASGAPAAAMGSLRRNGVAVLLSPAEAGNVIVAAPLPNAAIPNIPSAVSSAVPTAVTTVMRTGIVVPTTVPDEVTYEIRAATPVQAAPAPARTEPKAADARPADSAPLPPEGDMPEASVLRMLFGNHAPAGK